MRTGDPHPSGPSRFLGQPVTFNHGTHRLTGIIDAARYIGRTTRGSIPDYELTIRGKSGKTLTISLVESYASLP